MRKFPWRFIHFLDLGEAPRVFGNHFVMGNSSLISMVSPFRSGHEISVGIPTVAWRFEPLVLAGNGSPLDHESKPPSTGEAMYPDA